jgi:hypothetical protein
VRRRSVSKRVIGATLTKAEVVQTQIDALSVWITELNENFDDNLNRVVPFDYSAELTAAMDLHGISDPDTALAVFTERSQALTSLCERLSRDTASY